VLIAERLASELNPMCIVVRYRGISPHFLFFCRSCDHILSLWQYTTYHRKRRKSSVIITLLGDWWLNIQITLQLFCLISKRSLYSSAKSGYLRNNLNISLSVNQSILYLGRNASKCLINGAVIVDDTIKKNPVAP